MTEPRTEAAPLTPDWFHALTCPMPSEPHHVRTVPPRCERVALAVLPIIAEIRARDAAGPRDEGLREALDSLEAIEQELLDDGVEQTAAAIHVALDPLRAALAKASE